MVPVENVTGSEILISEYTQSKDAMRTVSGTTSSPWISYRNFPNVHFRSTICTEVISYCSLPRAYFTDTSTTGS